MLRSDTAQQPHGPHPHAGPEIAELIDAGLLVISERAAAVLTDRELTDAMRRFYRGHWGVCTEAERAFYHEGWHLLACFDHSGFRFHILTDDSRTITRLTLAGEAF